MPADNSSSGTAWNAVVIDTADNVAVALMELTDTAVVERGTAIERVVLREPVASGHKFALRDIAAGDPVIKYGQTIGIAKSDIAEGAGVHVHNVRSNRASSA